MDGLNKILSRRKLMEAFRNASIRGKLVIVTMLVSLFATALASTGFVAYQWYSLRQLMLVQLSTQAAIIADNTQGSLAFNDPTDAESILQSIQHTSDVTAAYLLDNKGALFAKWRREDSPPMGEINLSAEPYYSRDGNLYYSQNVVLDGEIIGTVLLRSNRGVMRSFFQRSLLAMIFMVFVIVTVSYFISSKAQSVISRPILRLAASMSAVSESQDFSLRAEIENQDELGQLSRHFNAMLSEIEKQTAQLRASEARFKSIFIDAAIGIAQIDLEGNVVATNPALSNMLGYTGEESSTFHYSDFIHPDDVEIDREATESLLRGDLQQYQSERRFIHKDGTMLWGRLTVSLVRGASEKPLFAIAMIEDITEHKRAEEALRESEEKFRLISEQSFLGLAIAQEHRIKYVNQAVADMNGYSIDEMLTWRTEDFAKIIHPDDVSFVVEQERKKQAGDKDVLQHYSYRSFTKSGQLKWLDQYSRTIQLNGHPADLIAFVDITERKQAENALRESEEKYRGLIQQASDGIFICDSGGSLLEVNLAGRAILGYSDEDLSGLNIREFLQIESQDEDQLHLDQLTTGKGILQEFDVVRKDGSKIQVEISATRMPNNQIQGIVRDITIRKQASEALHDREQRLKALSKELVRAQEDERKKIAHDLHDDIGQGLTAVSLRLERLKGASTKSANKSELSQSLSMLDQMLRKIRNLSLDLRPAMLDELGLEPTLEWYLDRHAEFASFHPTLLADGMTERAPDYIETVCFRVVQEALTNISRHAQAKQAEVEIFIEGNIFRLNIKDDGVGFDADAAIKAATEGKSLGLLGMQERAKQVGGTITIISKKGHGTEIIGYFPMD